ncbi:hypothetical protein BaRGS_00004047 [Batillaria attramentaria]|uniref:Uncharacterized protein n=1 Tax=Batillaria attramentaria TaxID=370345 RepID=A0ABD0LZ79_9CAEN
MTRPPYRQTLLPAFQDGDGLLRWPDGLSILCLLLPDYNHLKPGQLIFKQRTPGHLTRKHGTDLWKSGRERADADVPPSQILFLSPLLSLYGPASAWRFGVPLLDVSPTALCILGHAVESDQRLSFHTTFYCQCVLSTSLAAFHLQYNHCSEPLTESSHSTRHKKSAGPNDLLEIPKLIHDFALILSPVFSFIRTSVWTVACRRLTPSTLSRVPGRWDMPSGATSGLSVHSGELGQSLGVGNALNTCLARATASERAESRPALDDRERCDNDESGWGTDAD